MLFTIFISFVILLRLGELLLAKKNEQWMLQQGAVEYGKKHYPLIVALHTLFFVSLIVEYLFQRTPSVSILILLFYFVLLAFKVWVIASLGKFWNTKILRVPKFPLVNKGPYKYFRHPNYMVVVAEIAVIPLVFNLYFTAILFSLLNAMVLRIRIKEENLALKT